MLQSLGPRGSPKLQLPLLPQGRASPGQGVFGSPLATGSSKAETVEGKGKGREKRQKGKKRGVVAECGRRQPPKEPPAPQPRPQMWSQARLPCLLPAWPNSCYEKGCAESVRRQQSGLGGGSSPHGRSWSPSRPGFLPSAGTETMWVLERGRAGPTPVEMEAPVGQDRERVKIFGLDSSGVHPVVWYLHGSPRTAVAWGLGRSSGFPGMALWGVTCPSLPTARPGIGL